MYKYTSEYFVTRISDTVSCMRGGIGLYGNDDSLSWRI